LRVVEKQKNEIIKDEAAKRLKAATLLAAAFVIKILGIVLIKGLAASIMVEAVQVKASVLEDFRQAEFLVIRPETTVNAPFPGRFEKTRQDGERVARGALVGYLTKEGGTSLEKLEKIEMKAPQAGMLSYETDGYEELFHPAVWPQPDLDKLAELLKRLDGKNSGDAKKNGMVEAGQALFKIINNLEPEYLFAEINEDLPKEIKTNGSLELRLEEDGKTVNCEVVCISRTGSGTRLLLKAPGMPELQGNRKVDCRVILRKIPGVVLDYGVVVEKNGKEGVYLIENGVVTWRAVSVSGTAGEMAVFKGLFPGEWVVVTPELVKEGQRILTEK
jgi:putative membrane fusion protein